jgi:hypothetical protein
MSAVKPQNAPSHCPRCGTTILWCDGLPTPDLLFLAGSPHEPIGCTRCLSSRQEPPRRSRLITPGEPDRRPLAARIAEKAPQVVASMHELADIADRVMSVVDKWKRKD